MLNNYERRMLKRLRDEMKREARSLLGSEANQALNEAMNVLDSALWIEDKRCRDQWAKAREGA